MTEEQTISAGNKSTGLVGVWRDKFSPGHPTYKLLSDGTAQYIKSDEDSGTSSTSGFGKWELSATGQVKVTCKVKAGCTAEKDASKGVEEHTLSMNAMMFEGVFKRQKDLNDRDEERVKMLAEGKEVPPLHPLVVIDLEGSEKPFDLFYDEKLSDLKDRLAVDDMKIKVMLGDTELADAKTMYEQVPANAVLRLVLPKADEAAAPVPAPAADPAPPAAEESNKQEQITEAFSKWDVNNQKVISEEQLTSILVSLGVPEADIPTIYADAGVSKGTGVDYSKFINWIYSSDEAAASPPAEIPGEYKDQYEIVKWFFPYAPEALIVGTLVEKKGDRASVTKVLQTREDELAAKYASKVDGLTQKAPKAERAEVLEALTASGGDEDAALKSLQK
jgi:DNA-directed RNA polymerase subunit H (RpoH/RPB5)